MAVVIRLKRMGRRHRAFYRIEAIEKRSIRMEKLNHRLEAMLQEMDRRWVERNPLDR